MMEAFYFTFGSGHLSEDGQSLGDCFVKVLAKDWGIARDAMSAVRGQKWAFQYNEHEFDGQPEKYGLREVSLDEVVL